MNSDMSKIINKHINIKINKKFSFIFYEFFIEVCLKTSETLKNTHNDESAPHNDC